MGQYLTQIKLQIPKSLIACVVIIQHIGFASKNYDQIVHLSDEEFLAKYPIVLPDETCGLMVNQW